MNIRLCGPTCDRRRLSLNDARGDIALVIELRFSLSAFEHVFRKLRSDGPEVVSPVNHSASSRTERLPMRLGLATEKTRTRYSNLVVATWRAAELRRKR